MTLQFILIHSRYIYQCPGILAPRCTLAPTGKMDHHGGGGAGAAFDVGVGGVVLVWWCGGGDGGRSCSFFGAKV